MPLSNSLIPELILILYFCFLPSSLASPAEASWIQRVQHFVTDLSIENTKQLEISHILKEHSKGLGLSNESYAVSPAALEEERSRAAVACQISSIIFAEDAEYVDASLGTDYANLTEVNWSQLCWLSPQCFILPSSTADVQLIFKVITFLQTRFSIRSGGHNPNPGWSSISDYGVLVDLANLRQLDISPDSRIASVGPGNHWNDVYKFLDLQNVTAIGGRVSEVGVSGLLLGGGLPFFSSQYGLVCDNAHEFEVVLADSKVIRANARENPDLFFALKGGGPNFGVVTRLELYTAPLTRVWFEVLSFLPSKMQQLLKALVAYEAAAENDPLAGLIFTVTSTSTTVGLIYASPVVRPPVFESFISIPVNTTLVPSKIGTPYELQQAFASPLAPPSKYDIVSAVTKVDLELYRDLYARYAEISASLAQTTGISILFSIQPITENAVLQGQRRGSNALGISAEKQEWFTAVVQWTDRADDDAAHAAVRSLGNAVSNLAQEKGLLLPLINPNDASYVQNPVSSFGAENVARLKAASIKYDPLQVFQKLQNDGFLLSKPWPLN